MNAKSVIELNGKHYDVVTGSLLGSAHLALNKPIKPIQTNGKKTVDGVFRTSKSVTPASQLHHKLVKPPSVRSSLKLTTEVPSPQPIVANKTDSGRSANHAFHHQPQNTQTTSRITAKKPGLIASTTKLSQKFHTENYASHHQPQHASTLMRAAVQKPGIGFKKSLNVQTAIEKSKTSLIVKKTSVSSVTPRRTELSKSVNRSEKISHFSGNPQPYFTVNIAPLAVQKPPATPPAPTPRSNNKPPIDMFERAIANASNFVDTKTNTRLFRKKARHHVTSMAAGILALLILSGFVAYQNTPGLQLKLAGVHAGVATAMPNLKAAGFAWDGVTSQSGKVTVGFSHAGNTYQLTQQSTNWSGNDMVNNVASVNASGQPNYRVLKAGNTAVYRFDSKGATWVKDGTWYQVNGQAPLSDSQVETLVQNT